MLAVRPRIAEPGMHLFQRPVHPELLDTCVFRLFERGDYRLRTAITTAGHIVVFDAGSVLLTEVCAELRQDLPRQRRLVSAGLEGRGCGPLTVDGRVTWSCRFQIDPVDPSVLAIIGQQLDAQGECEGLVCRFRPENGRPDDIGGLSYVHFQAFARHALVRTFHTFPESLTVCRTESRFVLHPAA